MSLKKQLARKAQAKQHKCPWCAARNYKKAEKLSLLEKIRFIGCKVYVCLKCNKKWPT